MTADVLGVRVTPDESGGNVPPGTVFPMGVVCAEKMSATGVPVVVSSAAHAKSGYVDVPSEVMKLKSNCSKAPAFAAKFTVVAVDPFDAFEGVASGFGRKPPPV